MARIRLTLAAALVVLSFAAAAPALRADAVILDLRSDPLGTALLVEGPGAGSFAWDGALPPAHPSDPPGSLSALYDASRPSLRASAPLGATYTESDDFVFGAVLTIRPEGFEADPFGFHPITVALVNAVTTGFDRTGSLADFRADTFDNVEIAWFPQVSPLFGGPFLTPTIAGSPIAGDAFANFTFGSAPFAILPGVPHLITAEHLGPERRLVVTVYALGAGGRPVPIPGGLVEVGTAAVTGFAVDTLAISAYEDGFNLFAPSGRSLRAVVDYDLIFFAPGRLGTGGTVPSLIGLIRRDGEGANGLAP